MFFYKNNIVIQIHLEAEKVETTNRFPCSRNIYSEWKKKYYSINRCRKAFDKTQQEFIIKTLSKLGIEGNFLNLIKTIYEKYS